MLWASNLSEKALTGYTTAFRQPAVSLLLSKKGRGLSDDAMPFRSMCITWCYQPFNGHIRFYISNTRCVFWVLVLGYLTYFKQQPKLLKNILLTRPGKQFLHFHNLSRKFMTVGTLHFLKNVWYLRFCMCDFSFLWNDDDESCSFSGVKSRH